MIIAVLKEVKTSEGRVALVPANVVELVKSGHVVLVQKNAGVGSGFLDTDYHRAGATIIVKTQDLIRKADLIVKVKEPTIDEVKLMRAGQLFFGYLHLAALPMTLKLILKKKITAMAYDTLQLDDNSLPLLAPMSEIAGKLATQNGAYFLGGQHGGCGVLLSGTKTVPPANVLILGGGTAGQGAADIAIGMGATTTILDAFEPKIEFLRAKYAGRARVELMNTDLLKQLVKEAHLIIGAALVVGETAPKLVTEAMIKTMKRGAVVVDISVDQGGCIATSRPTTLDKPIFVKHGVLHYCVANMPGSVPVTATLALNNASFKYIKALCDFGLDETLRRFSEMQKAVNCRDGKIVHAGLQREFW